MLRPTVAELVAEIERLRQLAARLVDERDAAEQAAARGWRRGEVLEALELVERLLLLEQRERFGDPDYIGEAIEVVRGLASGHLDPDFVRDQLAELRGER